MALVFDVAVVGAGIAGSTLAALLAPQARTVLVDRGVQAVGGAPGVVSQLHASPALTELARRSVAHYRSVGGFAVTGSLEVAVGALETPAALEARQALAASRGFGAHVLTVDGAKALAPAFVRDDANGAVYFSSDGVADAKVITTHNRRTAAEAGTLVNGDVTRIQRCAQGYCLTLHDGRTIKAAHVALCTGVWAGQLVPKLSSQVVAVAHPYRVARARKGKRKGKTQPFVRFPGQLTYCVDDGDRNGLGTYQHEPVRCRVTRTSNAYEEHGHFDDALRKALELLPDATGVQFSTPRTDTVEGIVAKPRLVSVTPDGLPLAGRLDHGREGALWCVVGTSVAHAAGAAGLVAPMILNACGKTPVPIDDHWLRRAVDPLRFRGRADEQNEEDCLETYRDIWNGKVQPRMMAGMHAKL